MPNIDPSSSTSKPSDQCQRCGTCCRQGGPAFHHRDIDLIENGQILIKDLYTIRQGEPARDNVRNRIEPATEDIIKIKGTGTQWTCRFYDQQNNRCDIYSHRPLECRRLTCWDTAPIEAIYQHQRLSRWHLLEKMGTLWELVCDHQRVCDYSKLEELAVRFRNRSEKAGQRIVEMVAYDKQLRTVVMERTAVNADQLDFLLGRPLSATLKGFGLSVDVEGKQLRIRPGI